MLLSFRKRSMAWLLVLAGMTLLAPASRAQDLNEQLQEAMRAAIRKASPSVVQIVTEGGADMVVTTPKGPVFRKALGPTTGVIVSADGYIVSSAFNFLNNPTGILVSVAGHPDPYVARKVATDRNRMLTLLKIDRTGLPVPIAVPAKELRVGQWAIALGRTLNTRREAPPSVSLGVISAQSRIWGKALQTDCKVSPVNYGGPIIDIQGRVQGILIPASPQVKGDEFAMDETAGFEWYDSGIGFAIPLEDILAVLPRLKLGKDLQPVSLKGVIGTGGKNNDVFEGAVTVRQVLKDSAAERAGLKTGDVIVEIDGQPVQRMAQFRHILGRKYDGDKAAIKLKRGNEELLLKDVELSGVARTTAHPFLGILPMRDDPRLGVEVRFVFPKSPADQAKIVPGDRIVKFGAGKNLQPFTGPKYARAQFTDFLNTLAPGTEVQLEVVRKEGGKTEVVSVKLDNLTRDLPLPDKLENGTLEKAREPLQTGKPVKVEPDTRKVDKELVKRTTATGEHTYWLYVPVNYDSNVSHSLVVYLHLPGKKEEKDFADFSDDWADLCERHHMILLMPVTDKDSGWGPGDAQFILEACRTTQDKYMIDKQRVVAHGMGIGGQMALYLGFNHRDMFHGVAATGAVANHPRDHVRDQRLAFYLAGGELDPLVDHIAKSAARLTEMNFPVTFRRIAKRGREYLDPPQIREVAIWIDALDRQ